MRQRICAGLLALICVFSVSATALAAPAAPTLSKESETQAYAEIYDAQTPEFYERYWKTVKGNTVSCSATQRVTDDGGNVYWISDTGQLNDSTVFRSKLRINVNPNEVKRIKMIESSAPEKNNFLVVISPDNLFEQVITEFSVSYIAVKDTALSVVASGTKEPGELQVKRGAKIIINYKLTIDGENVFIEQR